MLDGWRIRAKRASSSVVQPYEGSSGCEQHPLSKDNRFLDEAFGNEREIVREPGIDPAFERANPGDSFGSKQQRHTGAGGFVGSRTVENDVAIPWNLSVALFDLFHSDTKRARDHLRKCLNIHGLAQVHD